MTISGRLDDVGIAEVTQFIHLGLRTGTLYVENGSEAEIRFNAGNIVAARGKRTQRLGDLLVSKGLIEQQTLLTAIERQRRSIGGGVLGEILLSMGVLSPHELTQAVEEHIQETICDLLTWRRGNFRFEQGDVRSIHGFERSPGELLPNVDLNTQRALLEAARILDESREGPDGLAAPRDPAPTPPASTNPRRPITVVPVTAPSRCAEILEGISDSSSLDELVDSQGSNGEGLGRAAPVASPPGNGPTSVQIVSSDREFVEALDVRLREESIRLDRRSLALAGLALPGEPASGLLLDLRSGVSQEDLVGFRRRFADLPIITIVDSARSSHEALRLGAVASVEADVEALLGKCHELGGTKMNVAQPEEATPKNVSPLQKLRRLSSEIRSGALSANATLVLLNTLAESSERSILFLVTKNSLKAIGGFGFCNLSGRPVVETIRGLTLPLTEPNALVNAVIYQEPRELRLQTDVVPGAFLRRVGVPASGLAAVLPVTGTEGVILLIYADNGSKPVEGLELLALAADQVGVAIENELLRERLSRERV